MADPFRLRLLKAISATLKSVTVSNGYTVDLDDYTDSAGRTAQRVFRGRDEFGANDPLPMLSILEDPLARDPNNAYADSPVTTGEYRILIQGFVDDNKENPTDPAHYLAADVIKALVVAKINKFDIFGLGGKMPCVTKMSIGQPVVRPADDTVSSVAFFFVMVTLTLVEDLEKPYD